MWGRGAIAGLLCVASAVGCRAVDLTPSEQPTPAGSVRVRGTTSMSVDAGTVLAPSVTIDEPADRSVFVRDALAEGEWIAPVVFAISASDVARVELYADGTNLLGEPDISGLLSFAFRGDGEHAITAVGYDELGAEVASDEIGIVIEPPFDPSCHAMLDTLGLEWTAASPTQGIADPVRVQPAINGVTFHYSTNAPSAMLMDCELAVRLHELAGILAGFGIDDVTHLGIYNYRCIGGGDPDSGTCTPSQHAYARAIDLHAFGAAGSDVEYDTVLDWIITSGESCPFTTFSDEDRVLKEIACALWSEGTFQIVLTPNYNDAHRDHLHVDLTSGEMFIGQSVAGVDPAVPGLDH
jgi:hypothetical protein